MPQLKPRQSLFLVAFALFTFSLTGCKTVTSSGQVSASAAEGWIILPVNNLSSTPLAGESAASMIETQLRKRGVRQLTVYQSPDKLSLDAVLAGAVDVSTATNWAKTRGYRFGITGTVHEWQYKSGTDKEPVVGLSLKLIDLASGTHATDVIWQASTARTGWGFANLTKLGNSVIDGLLDHVRINQENKTVNAGLRPESAAQTALQE